MKDILACQRIIIIGDAGRGKTTLAEKLSQKLNIEKYSTDDFYFAEKFSRPRVTEESIRLISEVYAKDKWIVEGTTFWLLKLGFESADIIIHLKYRNIFSQWFFIIKRHFTRKEETLLQVFYLLRHVFYKRYNIGYKKGATTHLEAIAPYKDKVLTLSSFKEINKFVKDLESGV